MLQRCPLSRNSILWKCLLSFDIIFSSKAFERFIHCVKSVRIRSFSGPFFPAFGLTTDTFHGVKKTLEIFGTENIAEKGQVLISLYGPAFGLKKGA